MYKRHVFRAICYATDDWVYGTYHEVGGLFYMVGYIDVDHWFMSCARRTAEKICSRVYQINPTTIGMYSGAYLSSDHPMFVDLDYIFEGDIIYDRDNCRFTITYQDFIWIGIGDDGDKYGYYTLAMSQLRKKSSDKDKFTKVGNIHQRKKVGQHE